MSNISTEQFEYFLHLLGALVEESRKQTVELERMAGSLDSIDGQIMDLSYHIRYGGGS